MNKRILYLSFYFEPDLCAGSFRNTPLVKELAKQSLGICEIDVVTTMPNRYSTYDVEATTTENGLNYLVNRIEIPLHQSGMKDQIQSFKAYYNETKKITKGRHYDLVIASSSRLFTAYLGYSIAKKLRVPLYLDIRDIFYDTLEDILSSKVLKFFALPIIKEIERKTFSYASHINLISEGFKTYFDAYPNAKYSYYPNGIDDIFINQSNPIVESPSLKLKRTIVYAGNLGEGQGLHKIIPLAAKRLESKIDFLIVGDGGMKQTLLDEIKRLHVTNVKIIEPVKRDELISIYKSSDFLLVHLNDYKAFRKVLPSKIFELATFNQPLIAGVGGYAAGFIRNNVENSILFEPCNVDEFVKAINDFDYKLVYRKEFIEKYNRETVNKNLADSMLNYL